MNLMNHELDVLPPYTILLLPPFSAFSPSRTSFSPKPRLKSHFLLSVTVSLSDVLSSSSVTDQDI